MMGRLNHDQEQFFYSFRLDDAVPDDHLVRGLLRFSTYRGCIPSLHPTIRRSVGLRSIRC